MDATELGRWTRFAAKGGIGKCTAMQDCVAEEPEDLMFLKDDEITVLMELQEDDDLYLGYCEGVVGRFNGSSVRFHGRLKRPVLAKRSSSAASIARSSRPSSSQSSSTLMARDASPSVPYRGSPSLPQGSPLSPGTPSAASPRLWHSLSLSTTSSPQNLLESDSIASAPASPSPQNSPQFVEHTLPEPILVHSESYSPVPSSAVNETEFDRFSGDTHDVGGATEEGRDNDAINPQRVESPEAIDDVPPAPLTLPSVAPLVFRSKSTDNYAVPSAAADLPQNLSVGDTAELDHNVSTWLRPESAYSSAETEESGERLSLALSDSGVNIGLSLLQDFVGGPGDDEDDHSVYSSRRSLTPPAESHDHDQQTAYPISPMDAISGHVIPPVPGPSQLHSPSAPSFSQYSASPTSENMGLEPPRGAFLRGQVESMLDPDFDPASWEGASDIFDDYYRLSRYSVMSRMSRMSKASGSSDVPPLPRELGARPSMDSLRAPQGIDGPSRPPQSTEAERSGSPLKSVAPLTVKAKPSPLTLSSERTSYQLLHGSFSSPPLDTAGSFVSSLTSPTSQDESARSPSEDAPGDDFADHTNNMETLVVPEPAGKEPEREPTVQSATAATTVQMSTVVPPYTNQSPLSTALPPSLQQQPLERVLSPASHISPSPVARARPVNPNHPPPHPYARQSLFMPHPNAPKPAEQPLGPLYGRQQPMTPLPQPPPHVGPPQGSVYHALHSVLRSPRPRQTTVYGWFEFDLSQSMGPVPVIFSIEPPNNIPANKPGASRSLRIPHPMQGPPIVPGTPVSSPPPLQLPFPGDGRPPEQRTASPAVNLQRVMSPALDPQRVMSPVREPQRVASPVVEAQRTASPAALEQGGVATREGAAKAIPRANFFPQAGTARPRSRSFSGFDPPQVEIELPKQGSRDDSKSPIRSPSLPMLTKRSKSAMATTTVSAPSVPSPQRATVSHSSSVVRGVHAPSPLSLSQNNVVAQYSATSPAPPHPARTRALSSGSSMKSPPPTSPPGTPASHAASPSLSSQQSEPRSSFGSPLMNPHPKLPPVKATTVPIMRHSRSTITSTSKDSLMDMPSSNASPTGRHSEEAKDVAAAAGISFGLKPIDTSSRHGSLRPSISTSMLRVQSLQQGERSPSANISSFEREKTTVRAQDMDFELVEPAGATSPLATQSVDSLPLSTPSPVTERSQLSPEPLTPSVASLSIHGPSFDTPRVAIPTKPLAPAQVEAHRQRELRWMQVLSGVSAAQARKSKKVRKMVLEGVPASVRYRVWAYLADSAAKRMDKLYPRLLHREKVRAYTQIEQDVKALACAEELPDTHSESLKNILQAYLSMVPDVQYNQGLCSIASQLLVQSPEEDAFWTFICLMDTHIRPYFSAHSVQLDVDASLFGKAVEANDSVLAKKLFVDLAIAPIRLCKPWFTSLFSYACSPEYVHRIWDVFLFEGVPFLFRVGIAILTCIRQLLLQCTSHDMLFALLIHPPPNNLPPSPDAFVELALAAKLKDDDVRKQRAKMEASVKRQTQGRVLSTQPGAISLPTR